MKPVETNGGLQVTGAETDPDKHTVVAPLRQLFTGLRVGLTSLTVVPAGPNWEKATPFRVRVPDRRHATLAPRPLSVSGVCTRDYRHADARRTEVRLTARVAVVSDMGTQRH